MKAATLAKWLLSAMDGASIDTTKYQVSGSSFMLGLDRTLLHCFIYFLLSPHALDNKSYDFIMLHFVGQGVVIT